MLGFWILYQGLLRDDNLLLLALGVVAGSALILGGLYLLATTRRLASRRALEQDSHPEMAPETEPEAVQPPLELEEIYGDPLNGSRKGD